MFFYYPNIYLSIYLSIVLYLSNYLSINLSIYLFIYIIFLTFFQIISINPSISFFLFIYMSLSFYLSICLAIYLSANIPKLIKYSLKIYILLEKSFSSYLYFHESHQATFCTLLSLILSSFLFFRGREKEK